MVMKGACIYSIDLTTNSNDTLSVSSDDFTNFYIANINNDGDEISYDQTDNHRDLYANFFMIKLLSNGLKTNKNYINRLYNKKDIVKIALHFTNGKIQCFDLPKKRIVNNGAMENKYQTCFYENDNLCILISDKNVKFKENFFI